MRKRNIDGFNRDESTIDRILNKKTKINKLDKLEKEFSFNYHKK